ncbi:transcriptional regulator [Stappia sp. 22II-S9-Z10]|nr:transcriptional regulator [Stappia sp. 22II-S9-Z10]
MDRLTADRMFIAVMDEGSFSAAAQKRRTSSGQASKLVSRLEAELGVRLLNRTTRAVAPTEAGRAYYARLRPIMDALDELDLEIRDTVGRPAGRLRLTAPLTFGARELTPALNAFAALFPAIALDVAFTDRVVNIVDEGFDLAVRIGRPADSSLIARKLCDMRIVVVGSPAYLAARGTPADLGALSRHDAVVDTNMRDGRRWPFRHPVRGETSVAVEGRIRYANAEACLAAAEAGLGLTCVPWFVACDAVAAGRVVRVLADYETAAYGVYALYPHTRHLAAKVRTLVDDLAVYFRDRWPDSSGPSTPTTTENSDKLIRLPAIASRGDEIICRTVVSTTARPCPMSDSAAHDGAGSDAQSTGQAMGQNFDMNAAPLRIGSVSLKVRDLNMVADYYRTVLGLRTLESGGTRVTLGTRTTPLLHLEADPQAAPLDRRQAGLFHTAFLMPMRADLGRWFARALAQKLEFQGASDHIVSEAIYLSDPEGNGIEVYADRPASEWQTASGSVTMATEPLLAEDLLRSGGGEPYDGFPDGGLIGHVHLQVGDTAAADGFYRDVLGFTISSHYPGASFYGSGGYHHQLAGNVWNSRGAGARPQPMTGLAELNLVAREGATMEAIAARAEAKGLASTANRTALGLTDPWGTPINLTR